MQMTPVQKAYAELLSRHGKLTRCEEETNDDPIFVFKTEGGYCIKLDCMAVELRHALTSTATFIDFVASHFEEMTKEDDDLNGKVGLKFSTALMSLFKRDDTLFAEIVGRTENYGRGRRRRTDLQSTHAEGRMLSDARPGRQSPGANA